MALASSVSLPSHGLACLAPPWPRVKNGMIKRALRLKEALTIIACIDHHSESNGTEGLGSPALREWFKQRKSQSIALRADCCWMLLNAVFHLHYFVREIYSNPRCVWRKKRDKNTKTMTALGYTTFRGSLGIFRIDHNLDARSWAASVWPENMVNQRLGMKTLRKIRKVPKYSQFPKLDPEKLRSQVCWISFSRIPGCRFWPRGCPLKGSQSTEMALWLESGASHETTSWGLKIKRRSVLLDILRSKLRRCLFVHCSTFRQNLANLLLASLLKVTVLVESNIHNEVRKMRILTEVNLYSLHTKSARSCYRWMAEGPHTTRIQFKALKDKLGKAWRRP